MQAGELRIAIVGAGQIARTRHIPGFQGLKGVRIIGVCNRHRESASRIAREFNIPKVYGSWEHVIEDDEVDAIVIATWPSLHCPITLAAFDAGKHVLTQARMAMNAREAQRMFDHAREHPNLIAMVVPSPYGLTGDAHIRALIASGFLGSLREVHVHGLTNELADPHAPLGWRQMTKYSGFNMLALGILNETVSRWVPPAVRVSAYASKTISKRLDPETGKPARVGTPDSVQVLTSHQDGSCGVYRLSGVVYHGSGYGVRLFGSEGTISYELTRDEVYGGRRQSSGLELLVIPDDLRGGWNVESDFVAAIRGERPVMHTTFAAGVQYMQFTEAVARSSRHQSPVTLPLSEFSNPSL